MKNKILNYIFCGIISLNILSCGNKTESKSETEIHFETELKLNEKSENQTDLVYSSAGKKVEIVIEKDVKFLVEGEATRVNILTENINNQKFMVAGPGISLNQADKDGFRYVITPIEKTLVDGKLEIRVTELVDNEENFTHKFLVPVIQKTVN